MHTGSEKGMSMFHGAEHICDMYVCNFKYIYILTISDLT